MSGRSSSLRNQGTVRVLRWGDPGPLTPLGAYGSAHAVPPLIATDKDKNALELRGDGEALHFKVHAVTPLTPIVLSVRLEDDNGPEILLKPGDFVRVRHQHLFVRDLIGCAQSALYELRSYKHADAAVAEHEASGTIIGPSPASGQNVVQSGNQNTDGAGGMVLLLPALASPRPATLIVSIPGGIVQAGQYAFVWGDNQGNAQLGTLGDPYNLLLQDNPPSQLILPNYYGDVYIQDAGGWQIQVRGTRLAGPAQ